MVVEWTCPDIMYMYAVYVFLRVCLWLGGWRSLQKRFELVICPCVCVREKRTTDDTEGEKRVRVLVTLLYFCFFLKIECSVG